MSEIQSTVEEQGIHRTLKVSVSPEHVRGCFDRAYRSLQNKAQLKGFRKGKAPRPMLEKFYGAEVERDVLTELIEEGCTQTIREHKLDIVTPPRLVKHEYAEGGLSFEAAVDVRPDVELGQYLGLPAEKLIVRVEDTHVDAALEAMRNRMAVLRVEEERTTVENGDVIVFTMFGFEGDKAVPGTAGEGILLEVGSGRFPEDFEKQLPGIERGKKSPIMVTFSEEHGDESLRGKTIRFEVTVTEIKVKVLPPLDDNLAAEAGIDGVETLDQLRAKIREDLSERARRDADRRMQNALVGKLVESHDFEVPNELLHETIHGYMHEMGAKPAHDSEESKNLHEALAPRARGELRAGFILDAIAKAEELDVTKEELENRLRAHLASAGRRVEEVRRHYSQPHAIAELRRNMLREKAAERVFASATVQEREVEESKVADRG
ncbi:MAG TPA: trigger factor [Candidatus Limnocylindrales bacterium]|nr:trigger factor [Candidatus Limnocylindrales bacterium]